MRDTFKRLGQKVSDFGSEHGLASRVRTTGNSLVFLLLFGLVGAMVVQAASEAQTTPYLVS